MKKVVYSFVYHNLDVLRHYNPMLIIKMVNEYNEENGIKHRLNKSKLNRYSYKPQTLPYCYRTIYTEDIKDFLEVDDLVKCNIEREFNYKCSMIEEDEKKELQRIEDEVAREEQEEREKQLKEREEKVEKALKIIDYNNV